MVAILATAFQIRYLEWKYLYFDQNFITICSQGSDELLVSIGSDNGLTLYNSLTLNRRQAITWIIDGLVYWLIYIWNI